MISVILIVILLVSIPFLEFEALLIILLEFYEDLLSLDIDAPILLSDK